MANYLLDTNHAGALIKQDVGFRARLARIAPDDMVRLCRPSVGELWFTVFNSARLAENRKTLEEMLRALGVVELDATSAEEYGRIRVELRKAGRPLPAVDVQIAAIARAHGLTLLTSDGHFAHVERLTVENWLTPAK
jgi:tRNA(fMet)-specific endonuclease VapC